MSVSHSATAGRARGRRSRRRGRRIAAGCAVAALLITGCSDATEPEPEQPSVTATPSDESETEPDAPESDNAEPEDAEASIEVPEVPDVPRVDLFDVDVVADNLAAPWGLARMPSGDFLITLRDKAQLMRIDQRTGKKTLFTGAGAKNLADNSETVGEGGLLGVALAPDFKETQQVFVYRSAAEGNEVLRGTITGDELSELDVVLGDIPAADIHNGGGLAFGPDGMLYIGTGDADSPAAAQDIDSRAGKILRVAPDGSIPDDNPMPGLPMWSMGHRNVQGFDWDGRGRLYASEFGASDQDEINLIRAGGNYGWPEVKDPGGVDDGFIDPLKRWPTEAASPSGLAVTGEGVYLASLGGERLWRLPLSQIVSGAPLGGQILLDGEYGGLRNVLALAGGDLLVVTNNTDGRGEPGDSDDQLLRLKLEPAQ